MAGAMRTGDTGNGYGWVSIALHWLTAAVVLAMVVIGIMSQGASPADYPGLVHLHTTIGITAYLVLWGRIVWRVAAGHPGPLPRQRRMWFAIGKALHFLLLIAIAVMLVSGPLMVWTDGAAIHVFDVAIGSPFAPLPGVQPVLRSIHGYAAFVIIAGAIVHVLAVFKHTVLDRDGTFDKIMIPAAGRVTEAKAHGTADLA